MIQLSLNNFPNSSREKDKTGLIWGCAVQPLSPDVSASVPGSALASQIARCKKCFSYINPYVNLRENTWVCAHCDNDNPFEGERYNVSLRSTLPELSNETVDYLVHEPSSDVDLTHFPVFLMIIDISGSPNSEYLARVQESIIAAMEAMPNSARIGLITFDQRVGIWSLEGINNKLSQDSSFLTHVHHIPIPNSKNTSCPISITQLLQPEKFLVPLEKNFAAITQTVEKICSMGTGSNKRGLGATIQLVTSFFSSYDPMNVRATIFLSGRPNYGIGFIAELSPEERSIHPSSSFYQQQAKLCSEKCSICFDLVVISDTERQFIGLPSLKQLANNTGGNVSLYHPSDTLCARDMYRRFAAPLAFQCLIRLRCPQEYEVYHAYGHLLQDETYPHLYHAPGCDIWKTFAFDFKHSSPSGFIHSRSRKTVLQVAFAHAILAAKGSDEQRITVERRLRIHTIQMDRTLALPKLYASANPDVTILLLNHKLSQELFKKGITEARNLLQDWLTLLLVKYNRFIVSPQKDGDTVATFRATNIDLHFSKFENLSWITRLVFGLLKSAVFASKKPYSVDKWSYLHCVNGGLSASDLRTLIYPTLYSFEGTQSQPSTSSICLSRAAVGEKLQNSPILLLDGYFSTAIHYLRQLDSYPPPKKSEIMKLATQCQEKKLTTPVLTVTCASVDQVEDPFVPFLVEEHNKEGPSFQQFIETCNREVVKSSQQAFQ